MAHFQRLICVLLFLCCSASYASFVKPDAWYIALIPSGTAGPKGSAAALCPLWFASYKADNAAIGWVSVNNGFDGEYCNGSVPSVGAGSAERPYKSGKACPANSTESGSECTCSAGYKQDSNGGVISCINEQENDCRVSNTLWNVLGNDRTGRVPGKMSLGEKTLVCFVPPDSPPGTKGCKHQFVADMSFSMSAADNPPDSDWVSEGESWGVMEGEADAAGGLSCTPGQSGQNPKEATKQDDNCSRGYKGSVNGVDVCIDASSGKSNGVDTNRITGTDGKAVTVKSEVACNGEKCTVTETRKLTNANGTAGATSTVTTNDVDRRQYCAQNPKNPVCGAKEDKTGTTKGQGDQTGGPDGKKGGTGTGTGDGDGDGEPDNFGGSCESGFTCEGDAIQCAIAQEQHKRSCELFVNKSPESDLYTAEKGKEGNRTADLEANESIEMGNRIDQTDILGGGAGVQDLSFVVAGQSVTLPLSNLNSPLAALGNLLVAVSFLIAFRIVGRG